MVWDMRFGAHWYAVFFSVVFSLWLAALQAQDVRQIAAKTFPSVVLLVLEDANGQPVSLGSGFFVHENVIATNMHVIGGAARGYAKLVGQKTKFEIAGIMATDSALDLALLGMGDVRVASLPLGDSSEVAVGDEVYVVGNPQGLEGTFSQGIVSGVRKVGTDTLFQITAPISPGSSGGPVLNNHGNVIGVAVATLRGGQNLNFAIPASYLKALLQQAPKSVVPFSAATTGGGGRSILSDFGGRNTEGVVATNFAWDELFYEPGYMESFSLTLQNKLRDAINDVYCLVIFYDSRGEPLDVAVIRYEHTIPPGLGKRVQGRVAGSVKRLTTRRESFTRWELTPRTRVEVRILDFRISE